MKRCVILFVFFLLVLAVAVLTDNKEKEYSNSVALEETQKENLINYRE